MWRLFKAEFGYNKYLFIGAFALLLFFSLMNIFDIHHDLCHFGTRKYHVIFFTLVIGYVLVIAILIALAIFFEGREQLPSPIFLLEELSVIPILYFMPIPLLFYASIAIYSRRQSYL